MKVLHVLASVGNLRGGPSFVLRNMTAGLAALGLEIDVVTTDDNGPERLEVPIGIPVRRDGVTYRYFPRQTRIYTSSAPMVTWLWKHVADYDIVHIHAVFTFPSTIAAWTAKAKRVPYMVRPLGVLNEWGLKNRRRFVKKLSLRLIEGPILRSSALIHYTSEQERIEAREAGIDHPSVVIPNPVDFEPSTVKVEGGRFRARYPETKGRRLVVFLSRISAKKGLDLLIPAFAELQKHQPDTMLVIAGEGDAQLTSEAVERARTSGLKDHVLWTGFLDSRAKAELLSDAELFVLPSYSENFGVAVVEALSFNVPVVVSDQVGIHHEVHDAQAGLVVPCEVGALFRAMQEILQNPGLKAELSANAGRLASGRFSRARILERIADVYGTIAGQRLPGVHTNGSAAQPAKQ